LVRAGIAAFLGLRQTLGFIGKSSLTERSKN
jgi:hypothetical protein